MSTLSELLTVQETAEKLRLSISAVSKFIERGIPTPRNVSGGSNAGQLWHQSTVKLILSNIVYTYVKYTRSYCSSHIIESGTLLQAVKDDLKGLIADNVKLEKLYGVANEKANKQLSSYTKELVKINKLLSKLNKEFQSLLQLFSEKVIDIEQFKLQNEYIQDEQTRLSQSKSEIESMLDAKKDTDHQVHVFKRQISRFAKLDIEDEQVLKQVLQRLIQKIEVNEDGTVKTIHYNIAQPETVRLLEKRGA